MLVSFFFLFLSSSFFCGDTDSSVGAERMRERRKRVRWDKGRERKSADFKRVINQISVSIRSREIVISINPALRTVSVCVFHKGKKLERIAY